MQTKNRSLIALTHEFKFSQGVLPHPLLKERTDTYSVVTEKSTLISFVATLPGKIIISSFVSCSRFQGKKRDCHTSGLEMISFGTLILSITPISLSLTIRLCTLEKIFVSMFCRILIPITRGQFDYHVRLLHTQKSFALEIVQPK